MITVSSDGLSPVSVTVHPQAKEEKNCLIQVWNGDREIYRCEELTTMMGAAKIAIDLHSDWFLREMNRPASDRR